jgi:hypothetical protein
MMTNLRIVSRLMGCFREKRILRKTIITLILFLVPLDGFATDVYLDVSATGCAGGGAVNTNYDPSTRSCGGGSSRVYAGNYPYEASQSLSNGDTLYIREGTYYENVTGKPGYMWQIGAIYLYPVSNVTVKPYNHEIVWISGGASLVDTSQHTNVAITIAGSNNTVDELKVFGNIIFGGRNNTVKNCDLSGGWDHQAGWNCGSDCAWPNVIRFVGSIQAKVQNCKIHDTIKPPGGGNSGNMSMVMHELDDATIVENSEFYNACSGCGHAFLKYQTGYNRHPFHGTGTHATYRYDVFWGPGGGIDLVAGKPDAPNHLQNEVFYQNIWIGAKAGFHTSYVASGNYFAYIYNNVFYNTPNALSNWLGLDVYNWFNNIIYDDASGNHNANFETPINPMDSFVDYNNFYNHGVGYSWINGPTSYSSLSAWSVATGKDTHSVNTNPNFINASRNFNKASDFKRTSYPANGRGGSWPSVMGAYITGNETIGTR